MPQIHPDWDPEKALAHLAQLRADADRYAAIADAFEKASEGYRRDELTRRDQLANSERMFAGPKPRRQRNATTK